MPTIGVQMLQGRTPAQKADLIRGLSKAAQEALGVPEEAIRIILTDVSADNWGVGSRSMAEIRGPREDSGS